MFQFHTESDVKAALGTLIVNQIDLLSFLTTLGSVGLYILTKLKRKKKTLAHMVLLIVDSLINICVHKHVSPKEEGIKNLLVTAAVNKPLSCFPGSHWGTDFADKMQPFFFRSVLEQWTHPPKLIKLYRSNKTDYAACIVTSLQDCGLFPSYCKMCAGAFLFASVSALNCPDNDCRNWIMCENSFLYLAVFKLKYVKGINLCLTLRSHQEIDCREEF